MASGITSASTLARGFGGDALAEFVDVEVIPVAIAFLIVVAVVNMRGIAESVRLNAVLTMRRGGRPAPDPRHRRRRARRQQRRLRPQPRVQGRDQPALRRDLGRRARLLRPDRLRGLRQHRRGSPKAEPQLPADTLRRAGDHRTPLPACDAGRLRGRPDRDACGVERAAGQGRRARPARRLAGRVRRDHPVRAHERSPDQHDHGVADRLRDVGGGHRPERLRPRPEGPPGRRSRPSSSPRSSA